MFLFREIGIQLCQIYTKINIYAILYKSSRFKHIIFSKLATNLKTIISHINIFTYSPYSPYYVTRISANGSAVYWSHDTDGNMIIFKVKLSFLLNIAVGTLDIRQYKYRIVVSEVA